MLNCQVQPRLLAESVDIKRTSRSFDAPRAESLAMMSTGAVGQEVDRRILGQLLSTCR